WTRGTSRLSSPTTHTSTPTPCGTCTGNVNSYGPSVVISGGSRCRHESGVSAVTGMLLHHHRDTSAVKSLSPRTAFPSATRPGATIAVVLCARAQRPYRGGCGSRSPLPHLAHRRTPADRADHRWRSRAVVTAAVDRAAGSHPAQPVTRLG